MRNLSQILRGFLTTLASIGLLVGGFALSLVEGNSAARVPTEQPSATVTWQPGTLAPETPTPETPTPVPPTVTPSQPPTSFICPPPLSWVLYYVQAGDTLESVANVFQISSAELGEANCLYSSSLPSGASIYVPPIPTHTPIPCGRPPSWISYIVKQGDTLYHISQTYGIEVRDLQQANCLTGSIIKIGQRLYVPPWASRTPSPTISSIDTSSATPTQTSTYLPYTLTPIPTDTETPADAATDATLIQTP